MRIKWHFIWRPLLLRRRWSPSELSLSFLSLWMCRSFTSFYDSASKSTKTWIWCSSFENAYELCISCVSHLPYLIFSNEHCHFTMQSLLLSFLVHVNFTLYLSFYLDLSFILSDSVCVFFIFRFVIFHSNAIIKSTTFRIAIRIIYT